MSVEAKPTFAGRVALAAAANGEKALTIAQVVVGDGNGNAITVNESMTQLVRQTAVVPVQSHTRVGFYVTFEGLLDETVGGFTIREAGLLDDQGVLLFVASVPVTEKLTTAQNAYDILTIGLTVVVSATASVTLSIPPTALVSIGDLLRAPFMTVEDVLNTPPASPVGGATYLVGTAPTGAWVGNADVLAQWNGVTWVFKSVPVNHLISVAADGRFLRRTGSGWRSFFASAQEVIDGVLDNAPVTPASLQPRLAKIPLLFSMLAG